MISIKTKPELVEFKSTFDSILKSWLAKGAPRTPSQLAVQTKLRRQSIYDLCSGKANILNWHSTKVIRVLSIIENSDEDKVFKKYERELAVLDNLTTDAPLKMDAELSYNKNFTQNFTEEMKNPVALKIYALSLSEAGVGMSEIRDEYGQYGIQIADKLVEKNILVFSTGKRYFTINKDYLGLTKSQVKEIIPHLNSFYREDHANQFRNYVFMRIDRINRDSLVKIHAAYSHLDEVISSILSTDESKGDIPFYCFSQLDTFKDKL